MSKRDERRKAQGEVVGGGYIVFRRGKKWGRVRITGKDWMKFFQPFEWPTYEAARDEADRLAAKHPGEKFCVFNEVYQVTDSIAPATTDTIAKKLYEETCNNDPIIHANRFPSWNELDNNEKNAWRSKVSG